MSLGRRILRTAKPSRRKPRGGNTLPPMNCACANSQGAAVGPLLPPRLVGREGGREREREPITFASSRGHCQQTTPNPQTLPEPRPTQRDPNKNLECSGAGTVLAIEHFHRFGLVRKGDSVDADQTPRKDRESSLKAQSGGRHSREGPGGGCKQA